MIQSQPIRFFETANCFTVSIACCSEEILNGSFAVSFVRAQTKAKFKQSSAEGINVKGPKDPIPLLSPTGFPEVTSSHAGCMEGVVQLPPVPQPYVWSDNPGNI